MSSKELYSRTMPESQSAIKKVGVATEHQLSETSVRSPSQNLNDIKLPFTVEGVTMMSPGVWNGKEYRSEQIQRAYERTDWSDPDVVSLFNEHDDEDSRDWIGEVKNVRMEGDELVADLDIVTTEEARKLAYGAKFGISPKVTGRDRDSVMTQFGYDNFSLVLDPAVKTTYINSEQQETNDDTEDRDVKNVMVKSTMSDQDTNVELSEEDQEQLSEIVSTVENADVEDLAEIVSPFMSEDAEDLEPHIEEAMSEHEDKDKEMSEHVGEEKMKEMAREAAMSAVEEMKEEMSEEGDDEAEEDSVDETEESMSVDDIADQVAEKLQTEEMSADEEDEGDEESEAVAELKEELEEVKEQLQEENEENQEEKTPNPGSEATGSDEKDPKDQVQEMSAEDLDKGAAKHLLRKQGRKI